MLVSIDLYSLIFMSWYDINPIYEHELPPLSMLVKSKFGIPLLKYPYFNGKIEKNKSTE